MDGERVLKLMLKTLGAAIGARWLARVSDARLHAAARTLLVGIGGLLIGESLGSWASPGLPFGAAAWPSSVPFPEPESAP